MNEDDIKKIEGCLKKYPVVPAYIFGSEAKGVAGVLNDSPVQLSYEIIRHGRLIFCSDRSTKVDMELDILSRYLDRRYYDKRHAEVVLQKMASGGFVRK